MKQPSKNVLLLEFKFHEEIIPSQLLVLKRNGYDVHLFLDRKLWDDELFSQDQGVKKTLFSNSGSWYMKLYILFTLFLYVRKHRIKYLVFNTLDSAFISWIIRCFPSLYKVGIAHHIETITEKEYYKNNVYSVQGILTLSKDTLNYLKNYHPKLKNKSCFYPIFFDRGREKKQTPEGITKIVVPGQVSFKRRDYQLLIDACLELKSKALGSNLKIYLLGNIQKFDGPSVREKIESHQLEDMFWMHDGRVSYDDFISHIQTAHYILPLLSTRVANYQQYLTSQISATFNWALGFHKFLIIHKDFCSLNFLCENAIPYKDNLATTLLEASRNSVPCFNPNTYLTIDVQEKEYLRVFEI
jgi:hypothetical protein